MKETTVRQMLIQSLVLGAVFSFVSIVMWHQDPVVMAAFLPPFIGMMFFSYWMTDRIARRFRPRPPVVERFEAEPTTERPEHAQRRRTRRRTRGRRDHRAR
jgi:hypothetical protein